MCKMSDTPVATLNTLMQKRRIIPKYELIEDGTYTINPSFTYQVTCEGHVKTGSGFSKKDAKHKAAKAILDVIFSKSDTNSKLPDNLCDSSKEFQNSSKIMQHVQSDDIPQFSIDEPQKEIPPKDSILPKVERDSSFLNIPKALENVCISNNLAKPEYNIQKFSSGTKDFQVECIVSSFKETATAETLEMAMQEAARKAWAKLQIQCQKTQCIKREEENFDDIVRSAECLLQSFTNENKSKENLKRSRKQLSEEKTVFFDVKKERNSEIIEIEDSFEKSSKRQKLQVKKEDNLILTKNIEKPIKVPFLNTVEALNQMCIDINLQKPKYEYTIVDPQFPKFVTVTCTVSTFKLSAHAKCRNEANHQVARKMIEKIQESVEKLKNSEKFDLQCEEAKFFVNGTVMSMLETISHKNHSTLSSTHRKSIKTETDDLRKEVKKVKSKDAIKILKELCKNNNMKKPQFEIIENNLFYSDNYKVACIVSTFKEESEGSCFEEAKMKSAQKMLERFTKLQNSYLEQLICSVKSLDYKNPSRWKTKK